MGPPTTDEDDTADEFGDELDERATEVFQDEEFVTFDEHNAERD